MQVAGCSLSVAVEGSFVGHVAEAGYTGLPISYVAARGRVTSRGRDMVPGKDFHMALSQGRNDAGA